MRTLEENPVQDTTAAKRAITVHGRVVADLEAVAARAAAAARELEADDAAPNDVLALRKAADQVADAATRLRGALVDVAQQRIV